MRTAVATVLRARGGRYDLYADGTILSATLRGRLKQEDEPAVLVGDRVRYWTHDDGTISIEGREPRHSVLRRRMPGRRRGVRPVASNLDLVAVAASTARPDWNPHLVDRFLAVAAASGLEAMVVLTKADLVQDPEPLVRPYRQAGYQVAVTSTRTGLGIEELRDLLTQRVTLVCGTTGVGKSSLLNRVEEGLTLRTGAVSVRSGAGRHTTVGAEMHPLSGGGFVVDTPGLRDVGLWAVAPDEALDAFPDVARFADACRFDDCGHQEEPGCAVIPAVEAGDLDAGRLDSYRRLAAEARDAARSWE